MSGLTETVQLTPTRTTTMSPSAVVVVDDESSPTNKDSSTTTVPVTSTEDFLLMDEDKDVIVDPVSSTVNRVSFMRRMINRPNSLRLLPSNNKSPSVTPSENSIDDTETSGSDHVDAGGGGKRRKNRISKPLDIAFRNLSYSVKTGLFRGEWGGNGRGSGIC